MSDMKIPPIAHAQSHSAPFPEDPPLQLIQKLELLITEFTHLIDSMPDSHHDLEKIAKHLREVGSAVIIPNKKITCETDQILEHILTQPLSIANSNDSASLLDAATNFKPKDPYESDLFKILSTLHEYPGPTRTLITELGILHKELKNATHRAIANG